MASNFQNIIKELCEEKGIEYEIISNGWIFILKKDHIVKSIFGYKFDLNSYNAGTICDDKYATSELCKLLNIPVVNEEIFYKETNKKKYAEGKNTYKALLEYFNENNQDVVLKLTDGTCGKDVFHIEDTENLEKAYKEIMTTNDTVCASPYYDVENEYRAIVLNGEVKLLYKKVRPIVVGDGHSTISELLKTFNPYYFKNYENDLVLREGEEYKYGWKFNLAAGSLPSFEIKNEIREEVTDFAINTARQLNMGFCSVDVIKCGDKYRVMEVNTGVMMNRFIHEAPDGYNIAKQIYSDAIDAMMK